MDSSQREARGTKDMIHEAEKKTSDRKTQTAKLERELRDAILALRSADYKTVCRLLYSAGMRAAWLQGQEGIR